MADARVREGRLDVPLRLVDGGATNLGHFRGHKLIVLFCPADPAAAGREVAAYEALAPTLELSGIWLVAVREDTGGARVPRGPGAAMNLGLDPDGSAFLALARGLPGRDFDARAGATFLIDRDGVVRQAWAGVGHAGRARDAACERP